MKDETLTIFVARWKRIFIKSILKYLGVFFLSSMEIQPAIFLYLDMKLIELFIFGETGLI